MGRAQATAVIAFGVLYLVIAGLLFLSPNLFGILGPSPGYNANAMDQVLHLAVGFVSVAVGIVARRQLAARLTDRASGGRLRAPARTMDVMAPTDPRDLPLVTDRLGRRMHDLRISVTDRCNFRCTYCMPREVFGPGFRVPAARGAADVRGDHPPRDACSRGRGSRSCA